MYYFLLGLQGLTTIVVFLEFMYIFQHGNSRHRTILMLLALAAWINNAGYFVEIIATTKNTAMVGTKICYLGKAFIPLLILMLGLNYCNITIPSGILAALAFFHFAVWGLVVSYEHQDLFYVNVRYLNEGVFPHLVIEHGPVYYVFMGLAGIYFVIVALCLTRQYNRETNRNRKKQIVGMLLTLAIAVAGLLLVLSGCTRGYDTTAVAYAIASFMCLWGILRYDFLDTVVEAKEYAMNRLSEGLIVLDNRYQILYSNRIAAALLPEVNEKELSRKYLFHAGRVYKVEKQDMQNSKGRQIFLYLLKDVTDSYYYEEHLEREVAVQTRTAEERRQKVEQMSLEIVRALADTIDAKDPYTKGHSTRVAGYAVRLAKELGYTEEELSNLRNIALLHDIGKISIPDSVLNKPDKLTDMEYEVIKSHAAVGGDILSNIGTLPGISAGARHHHERYDGHGYPDGLSGTDIPEVARIICIADAYDAMNSKRVYRDSLPAKVIRTELVQGKGTQFDPDMTEVFLWLFDEGKLHISDNGIEPVAPDDPGLQTEAEQAQKKDGRDTLTSLVMRYEGEQAISRAIQQGAGCLCFIDVDNMKKINDTLGHLAGDHLLQAVGDVLKGYEDANILCRLGGDEFLMFIPNADRKRAAETVQDLLLAFQKRQEKDPALQIASLSVGMCMCRRHDHYASVLAKADKALYHVKQSGKSDYYIYQRKSERLRDDTNVDMSRLVQSLRNSGNYQGALDVEYRTFTKLYEYMRNMEKRYGYEFNLALITLEARSDVTVDEQERAMNCMEQAIRSTIRSTDICSRYSGVQFLVIFIYIGEENIKLVMNRIVESYLKLYHDGHIEATYEIADMQINQDAAAGKAKT